MARPIVAVVYAEVTTPVVMAQTPPLLQSLAHSGRRVDAAVFASPRRILIPKERSRHAAALRRIMNVTGEKPMIWTHMPRDRSLSKLGGRLAAGLVKRKLQNAILLCRQPRSAIVGLAAREWLLRKTRGDIDLAPKVILDLRGIRDEEYLLGLRRPETELTPDETQRLHAYRTQEEFACKKSDAVVTVSRPMQRIVRSRYAVQADRIGRVPNHAPPFEDAEDLRALARLELGVPDDQILIAYCGTLAAWQMPERTPLLVKTVRQSHPNARLLMITPDQKAAKAAIKTVGLKDAIVRGAKQHEVAALLCAADYGLLLREDSPVNRVACPVKFGEYLACGLRPILTPGIGDQSETVMANDLGIVVPLGDVNAAATHLVRDAERQSSLGADARQHRRDWATENISAPASARTLLEFLATHAL